MNKYKTLTALEIVDNGATKANITLPEIGLKEVNPNGSWLEQKQIQSALESRKYLIEVERIEKRGTLSHAEWREDLCLAEVTQKTGGYWFHVGHSIGGHTFLYPEEALYLIESNCLLLKYNDVPVSLEQAYSLLLGGNVSILQYRVYAYFSRLGYKVLRHKKVSMSNEDNSKCDIEESNSCKTNIVDSAMETGNTKISETQEYGNQKNDSPERNKNINESMQTEMEIDSQIVPDSTEDHNSKLLRKSTYSRIFRTCDIKDKTKYFKNIPDLTQNEIVAVKTPDKQFLPENIDLNNSSFVMHLNNIKNKPANNTDHNSSRESRTYSVSDEVNASHVRQITDISSEVNFNNQRYRRNPNDFNNRRHNNINCRPINFWRVPPNMNYLQFRLYCQRPFFPNVHGYYPRFQMPFQIPTNYNSNNFYSNNSNYSRKRTRELAKNNHLEAIRSLTSRSKMLIVTGISQPNIVEPLQRLVNTFNIRYKTNIKLDANLDLIDETITETIELDDDESSKSKKPRMKEDTDCYHENFSKLKQLAEKIKYLEVKGLACATHRRAFSNALKTFNNTYKADVVVDHNNEVIDRKFITLDSSDSDCVIENNHTSKSKKLWNPFSGLRRKAAKKTPIDPCTSKSDDLNTVKHNDVTRLHKKYDDCIVKTFDKNWLPDYNDFGRAEVVSKDLVNMRLLDTIKESLLYDFLKSQHCKFKNWFELKGAFYENFDDTSIYNNEFKEYSTLLDSLVKPEDYSDMHSVLKKLNIIKSEKTVSNEARLNIDFDVYNRDIKDFSKRNPPTPHFRLLCLDEFSEFPSGLDIATLHANYEDDVPIIFAIVGTGSVSYLQINPTELPLYSPTNVS